MSSDGRWILSISCNGTIPLVADAGRPAAPSLPHADLLAKLQTLTNLRAVADAKSATGYRVEIDPFPG